MTRKTVNVSDLIDTVNTMLAKSTVVPEVRQGIMNIAEHILHTTGNYKGFRYLTVEEVPSGHLPGIRYEGGVMLPYPERFDNTDSTRVQYG